MGGLLRPQLVDADRNQNKPDDEGQDRIHHRVRAFEHSLRPLHRHKSALDQTDDAIAYAEQTQKAQAPPFPPLLVRLGIHGVKVTRHKSGIDRWASARVSRDTPVLFP